VHEVIQAEETGQVPGVTLATVVGSDPTVVMEVKVELVTCQLMECRLGGTSVEHPQYYHPKVLTSLSFSSPLLLLIELGRYHLVPSRPHKSVD
jgi:hypothetical protein